MTTTAEDHEIAAQIATEAGELLCALRVEMAGAEPAELRAAGDGRANAWIMAALADRCPGDAVLSEESTDDRRRL